MRQHAFADQAALERILTLLERLVSQPRGLLALHQLRPPPLDFTGRAAELRELAQAVEGGAAIIGIRGIGGAGKTALALKLAEALTPRYRDAQIFVELLGTSDQPLPWAEAMASVIHAYQPEVKLPASEAELAGLYQSVLAGQRAILLLDNARSAEQVAPLVPPRGSLLLATSRWRFALPGLAPLELGELASHQGRQDV